jgi:hypothetical protein
MNTADLVYSLSSIIQLLRLGGVKIDDKGDISVDSKGNIEIEEDSVLSKIIELEYEFDTTKQILYAQGKDMTRESYVGIKEDETVEGVIKDIEEKIKKLEEAGKGEDAKELSLRIKEIKMLNQAYDILHKEEGNLWVARMDDSIYVDFGKTTDNLDFVFGRYVDFGKTTDNLDFVFGRSIGGEVVKGVYRFKRRIDCVVSKLFGEEGYIAHSIVRAKEGQIDDEVIITDCIFKDMEELSLAGDNLVTNVYAKEGGKLKLDKGYGMYQAPIKGEEGLLTVVYGYMDDAKKNKLQPRDLVEKLEKGGVKANEVWPGIKENKRSLFNAKIYPAQYGLEDKELGEILEWLQDVKQKRGPPEAWKDLLKEGRLYSMEDGAKKVDNERFAEIIDEADKLIEEAKEEEVGVKEPVSFYGNIIPVIVLGLYGLYLSQILPSLFVGLLGVGVVAAYLLKRKPETHKLSPLIAFLLLMVIPPPKTGIESFKERLSGYLVKMREMYTKAMKGKVKFLKDIIIGTGTKGQAESYRKLIGS